MSKAIDNLVSKAAAAHKAATDAATKSVEKVIECGRFLNALREQARHGEWLDKLAATGIARKTAERYMKLAESAQGGKLTDGAQLSDLYRFFGLLPERSNAVHDPVKYAAKGGGQLSFDFGKWERFSGAFVPESFEALEDDKLARIEEDAGRVLKMCQEARANRKAININKGDE